MKKIKIIPKSILFLTLSLAAPVIAGADPRSPQGPGGVGRRPGWDRHPGMPRNEGGKGRHPGRGAEMGRPSSNGNGCPDGTISVTLSPDESTVSVIFDKYVVQAGNGAGKKDRKDCAFRVPMKVPAGYSVALLRVDYRGFNSLPTDGSSMFAASFGFNQSQREKGMGDLKVRFQGPLTDNFIASQNANSVVHSGCGQSIDLFLRTSLMVETNSHHDQAMATIDSADVMNDHQTVYYLEWQPCQQAASSS